MLIFYNLRSTVLYFFFSWKSVKIQSKRKWRAIIYILIVHEERRNFFLQSLNRMTANILYIFFFSMYHVGVLDIVPSDENRQLLYSKLTWEITLLASAQDFLSSALIVGLVERQTGDMNGR